MGVNRRRFLTAGTAAGMVAQLAVQTGETVSKPVNTTVPY